MYWISILYSASQFIFSSVLQKMYLPYMYYQQFFEHVDIKKTIFFHQLHYRFPQCLLTYFITTGTLYQNYLLVEPPEILPC